MAPTPTILLVLLGIFPILLGAHAETSAENLLHNDDAHNETSVVSNWTLLCQQLCSLNLSGPACGLDCASAETSVGNQHEPLEAGDIGEYNFPPEHRSELCETLCDNGLGGMQCICPVKVIAAASRESDRMRICTDFCRFHQVTLRGCKKCMLKAVKTERPPKKNADNLSLPSTTTITPPGHFERIHLLQQAEPIENFAPFENPADASIQASTETSSTPDWSRLCATLCRQGTGGILCNCDLAPF